MEANEKLTYTVPEAAEVLGLNRNTVYELCKTEGFPCIHIGKRLLIPVDGLHRWVNSGGASFDGRFSDGS